MAGFIAVQDRLLSQRLLQFLTGGRDRVARFFPRRLGTAQTDGNVPRAFQQRFVRPRFYGHRVEGIHATVSTAAVNAARTAAGV